MRSGFSLGLALIVAAVVGCGEEIIYLDRELFNPPPDAASGFLGYFSMSEKLTSCGNCHVGVQAEWEETHHADADLRASQIG